MAHEFKKNGDYYVSKSGSDANPGTSDLPFLTIAYAATQAFNNATVIVGTGVYEEDLTTVKDCIFEADGFVILSGLNSTGGGFTSSGLKDFYIYNFSTFTLCSSVYGGYEGCVFIACGLTTGNASSLAIRTKFINCSLTTANRTIGTISECLLINSPMEFTNASYDIDLTSSHLDSNSSIDLAGTLTGSNNNILSTITAATNSLTLTTSFDPLFLGSPSRLEFLVNEASQLISGGVAGINIGNVRTGDLQNRNSLEWGLNPDTAGNTAFNANSALLLTSGTSSQRKSQPIYLGQKRRAPRLVLNGITDFLNSVPDNNNALVNSNHLTIGVVWGDSEAAVQALIDSDSWEFFRYGERMRVDGSGLYTGESLYDWEDENDLLFSWYAIGPIIRDDYNEA